jgi:hypothetical protein
VTKRTDLSTEEAEKQRQELQQEGATCSPSWQLSFNHGIRASISLERTFLEQELRGSRRSPVAPKGGPWGTFLFRQMRGDAAPTEPCGREVAGALCARPSGAGGAGPSDAGCRVEERGEARDGWRAEEGAVAPPVARGRERFQAQAVAGFRVLFSKWGLFLLKNSTINQTETFSDTVLTNVMTIKNR